MVFLPAVSVDKTDLNTVVAALNSGEWRGTLLGIIIFWARANFLTLHVYLSSLCIDLGLTIVDYLVHFSIAGRLWRYNVSL